MYIYLNVVIDTNNECFSDDNFIVCEKNVPVDKT